MGVGGPEIPASTFQAANPIFILLFGLVFTAMWGFLGRRGLEPSTPVKFAMGLGQLSLGFVALWWGAQNADSVGMVGMSWLLLGYLVLVPADQQGQAPTLPQVPPVPQAEAGEDELVRVDTAQRAARVDGRPLDLTYLEFELLAHLVAHPGRVHTRDQLVTTVWGYGHVGDGRTVDVHIARLRRKLGAEFRQAIQTVRRVGYKYTPPLGR